MKIKEYFSNPDFTLFEAATAFFKNEIGLDLGNITKKPFSVNKAIPNSKLHDLVKQVYLIGAVNESSFRKLQRDLFEEPESNGKYEGLLIFSCELNTTNPKRTELAELTRNLNRASNLLPVVALYRYDGKLCVATSERSDFKIKSKEGEKIGRVHLLKDILIDNAHTGHVRILSDLQKNVMQATTFDELYNKWYETFDVSILNKRFFQELANWYFWAMDHVKFPEGIEKNKDIRNATNLIRLITRVIFIWFIKEKKLVSDNLFRKDFLEKILIDFNKSKKSGNYYNAILQNLFFGTLNQKMNERKFAESHKGFIKSDQGIRNFYRYPEKFAISEKEIIKLFADVPFLNGGLFDCLDKTDEESKKEIFVDGFTRNSKHQAHIPDYLFFAKEQDVDLNEAFGTKNKNYKVKGLLNLLESYKFTIAENTPIEEEIALDPELLGKVFENLLASYNPETQTTARKQTGSFYTPREIVNYMVDESLMEYLKQNCSYLPELETRLRDLFSYSESPNPFNEEETKLLIEAINNCKILDPACGSGAFPMGVLHKMVHVLTKLDNGNKFWRGLQRQKALDDTETAYKEYNKEEREKRLLEINDVFDNNASDYGRKLYLIENCIYGIDIQPIAVQISKLRFFISLIIDQNKKEGKENFGIRSLPNLETKFVAANSLIGLDRPQQTLLRNIHIEEKEKVLKDLRHNYFTAKTRKEKIQYQAQDKKLRKEIAKLLEDDGWNTKIAKQIVAFDPYNQNLFAPFFESEWMFGLTNGFDIVIGNPPYGAKFTDSEKLYFKTTYKHQDYQPESFLFFTEKSFDFLKTSGVLSFIIPNTWLTNLKLVKIRKFLTGVNTILNISHYHKSVFDAVVDTEVVIFKKGFISNHTVNIFNHIDAENLQKLKHNQNSWKEKNGDVINIFTNPRIEKLVDKLKNNSYLLREVADLYAGVVPYEEGKGTPPQTRMMMNEKVYNSEKKIDSSYRKVLRGSDINRYINNWDGTRWLKYGSNLAAPRKEIIFNNPKIVIRQTGDTLIATFDDKKFICLKNTHVINQKSDTDLKFILALINSNVLNYYFQYLNPETGEALAEVKKETVEKLPIRKAKDQKPFIHIVDKILSLKEKNPEANTKKLEKHLNEMVYKLYELTDEEIKIVEGK